MPEPFTELLPPAGGKRPVRRVIRWTPFPDLPGAGMLEVARGPRTTRYVVTEQLDAYGSFGRVFRLFKPDHGSSTDSEESHYDCCVGPDPAHDLCPCRGHARYGRCVHLDAIRALLANGRLDPPAVPAPAGFTDDGTADLATRCGF